MSLGKPKTGIEKFIEKSIKDLKQNFASDHINSLTSFYNLIKETFYDCKNK